MAYQMGATAVTLNDLEGWWPFEMQPIEYITAFYTISTDSSSSSSSKIL